MWADTETNQDFLNFRAMAGLVVQMVTDAKGKALSIGISGGWGVGKSSMLKLVEDEFRTSGADQTVFLTFNAWLYQGHDDAKAALMEEISRVLQEYAKDNETLLEKVKEFASRVRWFRVARIVGEVGASIALGVPVAGIASGIGSVIGHLANTGLSRENVGEGAGLVRQYADEGRSLLKPKEETQTPPQMIHGLRTHFEALLKELDITLVVFVDDLDRCLPQTVIGTLEAMRLFLFMDRTAFVIAADDKMIKEAVRIHFAGSRLDDDLVTSYFDKLIQVPLRVPPLGVNEVRAYLMLLFLENSGIDDAIKVDVCKKVNDRLAESWKGESVSPDFLASLIPSCPMALKGEFAIANRLAKQLTTSRRIAGNPRLIKRFLNTLSVRGKLAKIHGIPVDVALLAKILLFERCASPAAFDLLVQSINHGGTGKSELLAKAEKAVREGEEIPGEGLDAWVSDKIFVMEWLKLTPLLGEVDLRGALHVGRESLPLVTPDDRVSKEAQDLLKELLLLRLRARPEMTTRFASLGPDERNYIMEKLLESAAAETSWGTPSILWGLSLAADADPDQAKRLIVFLAGIQAATLRPALIPRMSGTEWGKSILAEWAKRTDLPMPFKRALAVNPKGVR